jgi:hypothetical protein
MQPFLLILFLDCKDLMQRAYDLESLSRQMIHVSNALFHAITSLSSSFELNKSGDSDREVVAKDARRNALLLGKTLEQ